MSPIVAGIAGPPPKAYGRFVRPGMHVCAAGLVAVLGGCALHGLDLNSASATQLQGLRSIGPADAERIVAGRPYASKDDLLRRHVVTAEQYDAIAGDLYVGPPGMPDYLRGVPPTAEGP